MRDSFRIIQQSLTDPPVPVFFLYGDDVQVRKTVKRAFGNDICKADAFFTNNATYKFSRRIPSRIASSALPGEEKYLSPSVD